MSAITCEQIGRAVLGEPTKRAGAELLWHCSNHEDRRAPESFHQSEERCVSLRAVQRQWHGLAVCSIPRAPRSRRQARCNGMAQRTRVALRQAARESSERARAVRGRVRVPRGERKPRRAQTALRAGCGWPQKRFHLQRWENGAWV